MGENVISISPHASFWASVVEVAAGVLVVVAVGMSSGLKATLTLLEMLKFFVTSRSSNKPVRFVKAVRASLAVIVGVMVGAGLVASTFFSVSRLNFKGILTRRLSMLRSAVLFPSSVPSVVETVLM